MRTLTLLRHAKSDWDDPAARDFDRVLNDKGRRAAAAIGHHLRREHRTFDHVVASPAARVRATLDEVAVGASTSFRPDWDRRLYLASLDTLVDAVRALPAAASRVLIAGHNPGLAELALWLAAPDPARDAVAAKFPTGSLATFDLAIDRWDGVAPGTARLASFVRPRDLDPALGPDD